MTQNKLHRSIPFLMVVAFLMLSLNSVAQRSRRNRNRIPKDTTLVDTLSLDTVGKKKKQPLDAPVIYEANDSIVFTQGGFVHLFGDGKVNYEDIELTSAVITMNTSTITSAAVVIIMSMSTIMNAAAVITMTRRIKIRTKRQLPR